MITLQSLKLDVANNKLKIAAVIDSITPVSFIPTSLTIKKSSNTILFERQPDSSISETDTTYNPEAPYFFNITFDSNSETHIDSDTKTIFVHDTSDFLVSALQEYIEELYSDTIKINANFDTSTTNLADVDDRLAALEDGKTITYQLGSVYGLLLQEYIDTYGDKCYEVGQTAIKDKFADCYFTGIYIDTQNTFVCTNEPSAIAKDDGINIPLASHCKAINPDTNGNIDLSTFIRTFDAKNDMFFVFLEADAGSTDVSGWTDAEKQSTVVGIIFSKVELQKTVFNQIKNVACQDKCNTTCQDVLPILWYKAFQLSGTGDLVKDSIKYWNLIHNTNISVTSNNCSCNG